MLFYFLFTFFYKSKQVFCRCSCVCIGYWRNNSTWKWKASVRTADVIMVSQIHGQVLRIVTVKRGISTTATQHTCPLDPLRTNTATQSCRTHTYAWTLVYPNLHIHKKRWSQLDSLLSAITFLWRHLVVCMYVHTRISLSTHTYCTWFHRYFYRSSIKLFSLFERLLHFDICLPYPLINFNYLYLYYIF